MTPGVLDVWAEVALTALAPFPPRLALVVLDGDLEEWLQIICQYW